MIWNEGVSERYLAQLSQLSADSSAVDSTTPKLKNTQKTTVPV